jgi:hypothetical protein
MAGVQVEGVRDDRKDCDNPVQSLQAIRLLDNLPGDEEARWTVLVAEREWFYSHNRPEHPLGTYLIARQLADDTCEVSCLPYHVVASVLSEDSPGRVETWRPVLQQYRCRPAGVPE